MLHQEGLGRRPRAHELPADRGAGAGNRREQLV